MVVLDISPSRENIALVFHDAGIALNVAIRTSDYEVTRSLVAKGLDYATLVQRPAGDLASGGLPPTILRLSPETRTLGVALVSNSQLRPSAADQALRELTVQIYPWDGEPARRRRIRSATPAASMTNQKAPTTTIATTAA